MVQSPEEIFDYNSKTYQVAVLSSPITAPNSGLVHCYFAMKNPQGKLSRLEIPGFLQSISSPISEPSFDILRVHEGLPVYPLFRTPRFTPTIVGLELGDANSLTHLLYDFLNHQDLVQVYPYSQRYDPLGPNSNTFVDWVFRIYPEFRSIFELPTNALGKDYTDSKDSSHELIKRRVESLERRVLPIAAE